MLITLKSFTVTIKNPKWFLLTVFVASCALASIVYAAAAKNVLYGENYATDRAQIEDLLARYSFALDWQDADAYANTFTEDGVLDWAQGVVVGRDAIRKEMQGAKEYFDNLAEEAKPLRRSRLRHFITNAVIKVDGDKADVRAFWLEMYNNNPERKGQAQAYGHSIDELKKVNGEWLFSLRKIYNEEMDDRAAVGENPAW